MIVKLLRFTNSLLSFFVITFSIVAIIFAGYALYDTYAVYEDAKLSDDILKFRPKETEDITIPEEEKFSLADIQQINPDICGWIRIDDTNIDYPILIGKNNSEYLDMDYKKEYSPGGSIFLDYRCNRNIEDDYTVIYGHNMAHNIMFSDIHKFADKSFFNEHKTGKLYCKSGVYDIKIYIYCEIDANKDIAYKLEKYKNGQNDVLLNFFEERAINKNELEIKAEDKIIMLSTCHGHGTGYRAVLACKIERSSSSVVINDEVNSKLEKEIEEDEENNNYNNSQPTQVYSKQNQTAFSKLSFKFKRLLNNPRKLILYIMIFFTVIIYVVLILRKIKQGKDPRDNDIKHHTKSKCKGKRYKGKH